MPEPNTIVYIAIALPGAILGLWLLGVCYGALSLQRSMRIAAAKHCPYCQCSFGAPAIREAGERLSTRMSVWQDRYPDYQFRMTGVWEITCPQCGNVSSFCPVTNTIAKGSSSEIPNSFVVRA